MIALFKVANKSIAYIWSFATEKTKAVISNSAKKNTIVHKKLSFAIVQHFIYRLLCLLYCSNFDVYIFMEHWNFCILIYYF